MPQGGRPSMHPCSELQAMLDEGLGLFARVRPPRLESGPTVGEVEDWEDRVALLLAGRPHELARFRRTRGC